jgi:hypothetical protein
MPERDILRRLIGHEVSIDSADGERVTGRVLNVNRRSLWLVAGDEDRFIALADISTLRAS